MKLLLTILIISLLLVGGVILYVKGTTKPNTSSEQLLDLAPEIPQTLEPIVEEPKTTLPEPQKGVKLHGAIFKYNMGTNINSFADVGLPTKGFILDHISKDDTVNYSLESTTYIWISNPASLKIENFINKCVETTGDLEYINKANKTTAMEFVIKTINTTEYANCAQLGSAVQEPKSTKRYTLTGYIVHKDRIYPDIPYDYEIKLDKPAMDEFAPTDDTKEVTILDLLPNNNVIWDNFEQLLGRNVSIKGYWGWGYGESRHFIVETVSISK